MIRDYAFIVKCNLLRYLGAKMLLKNLLKRWMVENFKSTNWKLKLQDNLKNLKARNQTMNVAIVAKKGIGMFVIDSGKTIALTFADKGKLVYESRKKKKYRSRSSSSDSSSSS